MAFFRKMLLGMGIPMLSIFETFGQTEVSFKHVIIDGSGPTNPHVKAVGDVNGDGLLDVVVASSNGGPLVWYESPNWTKHVIAPSGGWSCDAALADMDGDGDQDVVISEWYTQKRLEWYENPAPKGNPATDPWKRHIIGNLRAHDLEIGDIDGDGALEIATRNQGREGDKIIIWKRETPTSWVSRTLGCPSGEGLALADLGRAGRLDLVIGGRWYEAPKDILRGSWEEHIFADWPKDAVVKVADMNKDGRLDVVLTRSEGPHHVSWFESPPDPRKGEWKEHIIGDSIAFAHGLAIGDMDNDGEPDVVVAEMHQSPLKRVIVYVNEGGALKWRAQIVATTGSHNLCLADTRGEGRLDIIGANWSGPYQPIEMWQNLGRTSKR